MTAKSIQELDLSPIPGKTYWKNGGREWREEFIYFLMVDRFHDDHKRQPVESSKKLKGFGSEKELQQTCGGRFNALTRIKCKAIAANSCRFVRPVLINISAFSEFRHELLFHKF